MSFSVSSLEDDLLYVFNSMTDGDDHVFSDGISDAFKTFVESGIPQTTDSGNVPTGYFEGASTSGSITADDTDCADIIYTACEYAKEHDTGGDAYIADKIAEGLQKMLDDAVVTTSVSGTVVPPSPPPPSIPTTGTAKGGISCSTTALATGLKAIFSLMKNMTSGGNTYLSQEMAVLVNTCLLSGVVSTQGEGALEGSTGSGYAT